MRAVQVKVNRAIGQSLPRSNSSLQPAKSNSPHHAHRPNQHFHFRLPLITNESRPSHPEAPAQGPCYLHDGVPKLPEVLGLLETSDQIYLG